MQRVVGGDRTSMLSLGMPLCQFLNRPSIQKLSKSPTIGITCRDYKLLTLFQFLSSLWRSERENRAEKFQVSNYTWVFLVISLCPRVIQSSLKSSHQNTRCSCDSEISKCSESLCQWLGQTHKYHNKSYSYCSYHLGNHKSFWGALCWGTSGKAVFHKQFLTSQRHTEKSHYLLR